VGLRRRLRGNRLGDPTLEVRVVSSEGAIAGIELGRLFVGLFSLVVIVGAFVRVAEVEICARPGVGIDGLLQG
jgi:hypothetical protein